VQDGQDFDPIGQGSIVNDVPKLPEPGRTHVLPDDGLEFRHRLDPLQELLQACDKLIPKPGRIASNSARML